MPIIKEYSQLAKIYDKKYSLYTEATINKTMENLDLKKNQNLLDIGCGTGELLYELNKKYPLAKLKGIDPVAEMLSIARNKLPDNIELKNSFAEKLPYSDNSFNTVSSCSMFHYIKDPEKAVSEMHRVVLSNGNIIITDWCRNYFIMSLYNIYMKLFNKAHVKIYNKNEIIKMLEDAEFKDITIETYKINWFWGMMIVRAVKK